MAKTKQNRGPNAAPDGPDASSTGAAEEIWSGLLRQWRALRLGDQNWSRASAEAKNGRDLTRRFADRSRQLGEAADDHLDSAGEPLFKCADELDDLAKWMERINGPWDGADSISVNIDYHGLPRLVTRVLAKLRKVPAPTKPGKGKQKQVDRGEREPTTMQQARWNDVLLTLPASDRLAMDSNGVLEHKLIERDAETRKRESLAVRHGKDSLRRDLKKLRGDGLVDPRLLRLTRDGDRAAQHLRAEEGRQ